MPGGRCMWMCFFSEKSDYWVNVCIEETREVKDKQLITIQNGFQGTKNTENTPQKSSYCQVSCILRILLAFQFLI